jgi:hypothetical protein
MRRYYACMEIARRRLRPFSVCNGVLSNFNEPVDLSWKTNYSGAAANEAEPLFVLIKICPPRRQRDTKTN